MRARVVQQIAGAIFRLVRSAGMSRATASCPPTVAYRIWRCNLVAGQSWPKNCLGLLPGLCASEDMPAVDGMGRAGCNSSGLKEGWASESAPGGMGQAGCPSLLRPGSTPGRIARSGPESVRTPVRDQIRAGICRKSGLRARAGSRSGPESVGNPVSDRIRPGFGRKSGPGLFRGAGRMGLANSSPRFARIFFSTRKCQIEIA